MKDLDKIKNNLLDSPIILREMINQVPKETLKQHRVEGKWSIHEHACHLVDVQNMLIDRFERIKEGSLFRIEPYLPGTNIDVTFLMNMALEEALNHFPKLRSDLIGIVDEVAKDRWEVEIEHPEYNYYTPYVLLRHILMHDHLHMYRIEELWLTNEEFLPNRND